MSIHSNNLYSVNTSLSEPGAGEEQGDDDGGGGGGGGPGGGPMDPRAPRSNSSSPGVPPDLEGVPPGGGGPHPQGHKSGSNSPTEGSPSKRRSCSGEQELYTFIQELDQER